MLQGLPGALSGQTYSSKRTIAYTLSFLLSRSCATVCGAARYEIYITWKGCFRSSAQLSVQKVAEPAFTGSQLILMLDCFIVLCELPLYIALLTHRFVISTRKVKVVTWLCMLWSVALRVLEGVILIAYFAGTYDRMKR